MRSRNSVVLPLATAALTCLYQQHVVVVVDAYAFGTALHCRNQRHRPFVAPLRSSTLTDDDVGSDVSEKTPPATILDLVLTEHKPMGCTVEESLAPEDDDTTPVFVSKVVEGGNADKAGLVAGDVILAVTGVFDAVEDVTTADVDRVRALVSGRSPDAPLTLRVSRGTDVMARHEAALLDLCLVGSDDAVEECINSIMTDDDLDDLDDENVGIVCDEQGECLLDAMADFWSAESDEAFGVTRDTKDEAEKGNDEKPDEPKKVQARPWANRSSPSGTYVRDPATGKMRNIS